MITCCTIFWHQFVLYTFNRSEIHDKMNCDRCRVCDSIHNDMHENTVEIDGIEPKSEDNQPGQNAVDIGGFAEISGCLHLLKSSEKQVAFL